MCRSISQTIQDSAIVTIEGELETACKSKLSNDEYYRDLEMWIEIIQGH